ncbi:MAG: methyltransferase [Ekhidna sp.]
MPNTHFQFKEFRVEQARSGMKVTTDGCLFGAWVAKEIAELKSEPKRILDIGTGTGLLSLMLAQASAFSKIDAIEINAEAFQEASANFSASAWNQRLQCRHLSIQKFSEQPYDIIICNPPFFQGSQLGNESNKNDAVHSTFLSAADLLESIRRLLAKDGIFYLLYPEREMDQFIDLSKKSELFLNQIVTVKNRSDESVFRKVAQFGFQIKDCEQRELAIRREDHKYTDGFWDLIKDYYLEYNNPNASSG